MSGRMQRSGADLDERRFLTGPPAARASATACRSEPTASTPLPHCRRLLIFSPADERIVDLDYRRLAELLIVDLGPVLDRADVELLISGPPSGAAR